MKMVLRLADKIKYVVIFFASFVFDMIFLVNSGSIPSLYPASYTVALFDYSFGFCARFLPGQIYRWVSGGNYAFSAVQTFYRILTLIAFLLISTILSEFVKSASKENRKWYILISLFYALGPVTFSVFSYGLGSIDVYWVILFPIILLMLKNKVAKFFIPLLVIPMVLVHFTVMICYMILVFFVLLYILSIQKDKKGRIVYSSLFAVCFIISVSLSVYFVLFESSNVKYTAEEAAKIIMERSQIGDHTDLLYFNFDIFKVVTIDNFSFFEGLKFPFYSLKEDILIPPDSSVPSFIARAVNAVWPNFHFHMTYYMSKGRLPDELVGLVMLLLFSTPLLSAIFGYWRHRIRIAKEENNKFQALLCRLMIIYIPVVLIFWFVFSVDYFRYINHTFIIEGACMLFVMYLNREDTEKWLKERFKKYSKEVFVIYSVIYFSTGCLVT